MVPIRFLPRPLGLPALLAAGVILWGCAPADPPAAAAPAPQPAIPAAAWDSVAKGRSWSRTVVSALDTGPAASLIDRVPRDAATFCPAFADADRQGRKAFWVGFLAELTRRESTWREDVSGGSGRWHGLLQISPATAAGYGCPAPSEAALKDGANNLRCGLRIMGQTVARDGVIAEGGDGIAADWGPLARPAPRAAIAASTRALPACQG
ncbi:MAG: lytic transglycosylase [Pseudomonadota bacterium]